MKPPIQQLLQQAAKSQREGATELAIDALERALQLDPNLGDIHNDLALVLEDAGRVTDALGHFARATELCPNQAAYFSNHATALEGVGRVDEAIPLLRRAIELNAGFSPLYSNLLMAMHYNRTDPHQLYEEHLRWARLAEAFPAPAPHANDRNPDRRLRIGYVSPDFRDHSVAYFSRSFLAAHDHARFEIFCYDTSRRADALTQSFRLYADHWRRATELTDEALAQQIRADQIDILVDLAGHTAGNRMLVFARKVAPVQITYLGYPDTTGMRRIDCRLTDAVADPPGLTDPFTSERLVRLPSTAWCYTPAVDAPEVAPLPASSAHHVTFTSFNNFAKVTRAVRELWAKVLRAAPASRLLLRAKCLGDDAIAREVREFFTSRGIDAARLEFQRATAGHLPVYNHCDIALDPFPYSGTATTCEALWMGVPVITLAGNTHASRVSASLLTSVGLAELIATTDSEYVEIAARLASDVERLSGMRAGLRQRMRASPLMDTAGFTRALEDTYRTMWRRWVSRALIPSPGIPGEG